MPAGTVGEWFWCCLADPHKPLVHAELGLGTGHDEYMPLVDFWYGKQLGGHVLVGGVRDHLVDPVHNGWRVPEIADALGVARHRVRYWKDRGRQLGSDGLSVPFPSMEPRADPHPGRLTVADVADCLRVDLATVRRWIKDGTLPAIRASRADHASWLIEASWLRELGVEGGTITVQEMAQREGVHPMTVREWIKSGRLAAVSFKAGGLLGYR
jgi:excisionase family DNA binding protein